VTEISAHTDNARCYKSPQLLFGLYTVALINGLSLMHYIHAGVQDGKGAIDGHFATAMRHIMLLWYMGNDVVTPAQIVQALWANGGVNNCVAELVDINRETIDNFVSTNKVIINHLSPAKNHFDVLYDNDASTMTLFQFSGIGRGAEFSLTEASLEGRSSPSVKGDDSEQSDEDIDNIASDKDTPATFGDIQDSRDRD
jgi:hypothetical protein